MQKKHSKLLVSLALMLAMLTSLYGGDVSANTTYTITSTLDAHVSSNKTNTETVAEGGSITYLLTPTTGKYVSSIKLTKDADTVTITPPSSEVILGNFFHARTEVAANNAVTLYLTDIGADLSIDVKTTDLPANVHTVTVQNTPYVTHNSANVQTVAHNGNLSYLFSPHYTKLIDRFVVHNGTSSSTIYIDNGLYAPDGVYSIAALSNVDNTVRLELTNITKNLTITPILVDSGYDNQYPYSNHNNSTNSNTSSSTDMTSHTIRKVQTLPYNRKIAEITVRSTHPKYAIDRIELRDGRGETATIYRLDGEFYFGGSKQDIKWDYNGDYEYARFEVEYEKYLHIKSRAIRDTDTPSNRNYPNYTPKPNQTLFNLIKKEYDGTKIYFTEGTPIKKDEMTGLEVRAQNPDSVIKQVKLDIGKYHITINRGADKFTLGDTNYPISWNTENGIEVMKTSLKAIGHVTVYSYGESKKDAKPLPQKPEKPIRTHSYIKGRSDTVFAPQNKVTRAEAVTMLNKAFNPAITNLNGYRSMDTYRDINMHFWGSGDINYALSQGYLNVLPKLYSDKKKLAATRTLDELIVSDDKVEVFKPNAPMTRAEFISLLLTYAKETTHSYSVEDMMYYDIPRGYWAYNYIIEGTKKGVIQGYGGYFNPNREVQRAEAVAMINRALGRPVSGLKGLYKMNFVDVTTNDWYYNDILSAVNNLR